MGDVDAIINASQNYRTMGRRFHRKHISNKNSFRECVQNEIMMEQGKVNCITK